MKKIGTAMLNIGVNIFLIILFLWALYPLIWQVITSFRTTADLFANPWGLPSVISFDNYIKAWTTTPLSHYFKNSLIVSITSVSLIMIISSMAAYGLSRIKFPGSKLVLMIVTSFYFVPQHVALIPLLRLLRIIGISNTYFAVIFPFVAFAIPFSTILIRSFILGLPQELLDAAQVDGCSKTGVFFRIVFPIIKPILAVVLVVQFVNSWNEYLFALVFLHSASVKTLPVGLMDFVGEFFIDWGATAAGLTLATIPVVIIYLIFRNQIISGMTAGSLKG